MPKLTLFVSHLSNIENHIFQSSFHYAFLLEEKARDKALVLDFRKKIPTEEVNIT